MNEKGDPLGVPIVVSEYIILFSNKEHLIIPSYFLKC
jgi:hypothetical protein